MVEDYAAAGQSGEMRGYDQGVAAAADDVGILLVGADVEEIGVGVIRYVWPWSIGDKCGGKAAELYDRVDASKACDMRLFF